MLKVIFAVPLGLVLGCVTVPYASAKGRMKLYFDDETMKTEIKKYISVGMSVDKAKHIMQRSGFECDVITYEPGLPKLRCLAIYRPLLGMLMHFGSADEIWVHLRYKDGVVKEIKVNCQTCGP